MCFKCIEFETPFLPTSQHTELHPVHNKDIHNSYDMVQRRHNLSSCIRKLWSFLFVKTKTTCTYAHDRILILEQELLITVQLLESAIPIPQF